LDRMNMRNGFFDKSVKSPRPLNQLIIEFYLCAYQSGDLAPYAFRLGMTSNHKPIFQIPLNVTQIL